MRGSANERMENLIFSLVRQAVCVCVDADDDSEETKPLNHETPTFAQCFGIECVG